MTHVIAIDIGLGSKREIAKRGGLAVMSPGKVVSVWVLPLDREECWDLFNSSLMRLFLDNTEGAVVMSDWWQRNVQVWLEQAPGAMYIKGRQIDRTSVNRSEERWLSFCTALGLTAHLVPAVTWQAALLKGFPGADTKARSIARVNHLYPDVDLRPGKMTNQHNGMSDAICIGDYGLTEGATL